MANYKINQSTITHHHSQAIVINQVINEWLENYFERSLFVDVKIIIILRIKLDIIHKYFLICQT